MEPQQKLLFVDLTTGSIRKRKIDETLRRKFLGGRGIDAYIVYSLVPAAVDPFSPENVLSIGAGILVGTGMPSCSRTHIAAKSPLTGIFGSSNMGGEFGAEMRFAGYDHLVITGKARKPVYLLIRNDDVELKDASDLWGKDTCQTEILIREIHDDPDIKVMCIGPAGENLVRYAVVISPPKNAAGRTGMGAIMGSKNLKAIAVRGTKGVAIANPMGVLNLREEMTKRLLKSKAITALRAYGTNFIYSTSNWAGQIRVRNFQLNQMEDGRDLEPENFVENYSSGPVACFGCPIHCRHKYIVPTGPFSGTMTEGPEYTYIGAFGTEVGNPRLDVVLAAGHLANLYGIDVLEYGSMLSWAMELYEKGLISEKDTNGLSLEWGNPDLIIGMLEKVSRREGFGKILAEGPKRAIEALGAHTGYYNIHVKGMSGLHSDERSVPAFALGIGVSTRGADHLRSRPALNLLNLPKEVYAELYGFEVVNDYRSYESKGKIIGWHEECYAVGDATGICKTTFPFFTPHLFTFKDFARMVTEVTGLRFTENDMKELGRRIYTLERLFDVREGIGRKDDYLPERFYKEPTPLGPETNRGKVIDRTQYDKMLDEYYEYHGWDREGRPTAEALKKIGLENVDRWNLL